MRRKGFTLIELLVVIAIIGILAGMLFPVFARAREAARKIQCLSNVKNIAMAFQMYLVDYDRFYPGGKSDPQVMGYINDHCGGCQLKCRHYEFNPYLRAPVILDEYIKNRDVWRCPSAKYSTTAVGVVINSCTPDWWTVFKQADDNGDCPRPKPCAYPFPPGWGGDVTDSIAQGRCGTQGAFDQSIGTPCTLRDLKTSELRDVSKMVVCGDSGTSLEGVCRTSQMAYPDMARFNFLLYSCGAAESGNCSSDSSCGNPSVASQCSPLSLCYGGDGRFTRDVSYRKTFARHLGGENLGFADGHAKWMNAETILNGGWDQSHHGIHPQVFYGLCTCFNPTNQSRWDFPEVNDPTAALY